MCEDRSEYLILFWPMPSTKYSVEEVHRVISDEFLECNNV